MIDDTAAGVATDGMDIADHHFESAMSVEGSDSKISAIATNSASAASAESATSATSTTTATSAVNAAGAASPTSSIAAPVTHPDHTESKYISATATSIQSTEQSTQLASDQATTQAETQSETQAETQSETQAAEQTSEQTMTQTTTQTTTQPTEQTSTQAGSNTTEISMAATTSVVETTTQQTTTSGSNPIKDMIICIDPGHQKKQNSNLEPIAPGSATKKAKVSSGTAGIVTGDSEYALNLAVALKLKSLLEADGAIVIMTRTSNDVDISNVERAKIGNDAGADLAIRIHADSSTNREVRGASMLIPSTSYIGDELAAESKIAGQFVMDSVISATGAKNRGLVLREDMTGFNWSTIPVILIEMGFMSNPDDDRLLATDDYRTKMATGLYNGCVAYFNNLMTRNAN